MLQNYYKQVRERILCVICDHSPWYLEFGIVEIEVFACITLPPRSAAPRNGAAREAVQRRVSDDMMSWELKVEVELSKVKVL